MSRIYVSSGRVSAEFTVISVFVPLVVDEFAIVMGSGGIKVERARVASVTCVGTPEIFDVVEWRRCR